MYSVLAVIRPLHLLIERQRYSPRRPDFAVAEHRSAALLVVADDGGGYPRAPLSAKRTVALTVGIDAGVVNRQAGYVHCSVQVDIELISFPGISHGARGYDAVIVAVLVAQAQAPAGGEHAVQIQRDVVPDTVPEVEIEVRHVGGGRDSHGIIGGMEGRGGTLARLVELVFPVRAAAVAEVIRAVVRHSVQDERIVLRYSPRRARRSHRPRWRRIPQSSPRPSSRGAARRSRANCP